VKFIVGLGNPGEEYAGTKHNIGSAVVRELAKECRIKLAKKMHFSLIGRGEISGEEVTLALPETYMNLSGKAVGELVRREVKDLKDLIVVCDDINLELGKIRIKKSGSSGGQKGLESIIHTIGTDAFPRLRVGIATEVHRGDITGYVLSPFKRKERRNAVHAVLLAKDSLLSFLTDGIDKAMSKFNKRKAGTS
jgi:PTH1 family peptidyl-tRNA hydrolase